MSIGRKYTKISWKKLTKWKEESTNQGLVLFQKNLLHVLKSDFSMGVCRIFPMDIWMLITQFLPENIWKITDSSSWFTSCLLPSLCWKSFRKLPPIPGEIVKVNRLEIKLFFIDTFLLPKLSIVNYYLAIFRPQSLQSIGWIRQGKIRRTFAKTNLTWIATETIKATYNHKSNYFTLLLDHSLHSWFLKQLKGRDILQVSFSSDDVIVARHMETIFSIELSAT